MIDCRWHNTHGGGELVVCEVGRQFAGRSLWSATTHSQLLVLLNVSLWCGLVRFGAVWCGLGQSSSATPSATIHPPSPLSPRYPRHTTATPPSPTPSVTTYSQPSPSYCTSHPAFSYLPTRLRHLHPTPPPIRLIGHRPPRPRPPRHTSLPRLRRRHPTSPPH